MLDKYVKEELDRKTKVEQRRELKRQRKLSRKSWLRQIYDLYLLPRLDVPLKKGRKDEVKILETKDRVLI